MLKKDVAVLPFVLASRRGLAGPESRVADEGGVGAVPASIAGARTRRVGGFGVDLGALRVICLELRDGKSSRCAAVDARVECFGIEVQVDGVGH